MPRTRVREAGQSEGKGGREQNNEWPETLHCLQQQKSVILYMTYALLILFLRFLRTRNRLAVADFYENDYNSWWPFSCTPHRISVQNWEVRLCTFGGCTTMVSTVVQIRHQKSTVRARAQRKISSPRAVQVTYAAHLTLIRR